MEIQSDGSVINQTFTPATYKGSYPVPNLNRETYGEYYHRVEVCKLKGFHMGDLSWADYARYCKGSPHNPEHVQDEIM
jgi:hypothetical protein